MSDKLTQLQIDALKLVKRSPDHYDGWRKCSPGLWKQVVSKLPSDLIESVPTKDGFHMVRLTTAGEVVVQWL